MGNIRIVTDSTADIPLEMREALGIEMVPLKVHFAGETYLDTLTISSAQFYEKLAGAKTLPTTSQPSPVDFVETYKRVAAEPGTQIISIHLSSAFSGTYQSALLAKSLLEDQTDITIVDSKSASYGIGLLAVAAAEAAREGKSKDEILALIRTMREQSVVYFLVDTLEFLQKGGRIGKAAAFVGSLLNIKPILTIDEDGEIASVDKVRGQKKAMARIMELIAERGLRGRPVRIVVVHSNAIDTADEWSAILQEQLDVKSVMYATIGPVIGTHAGPGTTGVFVLPV